MKKLLAGALAASLITTQAMAGVTFIIDENGPRVVITDDETGPTDPILPPVEVTLHDGAFNNCWSTPGGAKIVSQTRFSKLGYNQNQTERSEIVVSVAANRDSSGRCNGVVSVFFYKPDGTVKAMSQHLTDKKNFNSVVNQAIRNTIK